MKYPKPTAAFALNQPSDSHTPLSHQEAALLLQLAKELSREQKLALMGGRTYTGFPNQDKEDEARRIVNDMASALGKADAALVKGDRDTVAIYTRWFGAPGGALTLNAMQAKIHKMAYALNKGNIDISYNVHCGGPNPPYASSSTPPGGGEQSYNQLANANIVDIDLCPSFFKRLTQRGDNSALVTVAHEFSHAVLDTNDHPDPVAPAADCSDKACAKRLAAATPALAVTNAENIAQFISEFS